MARARIYKQLLAGAGGRGWDGSGKLRVAANSAANDEGRCSPRTTGAATAAAYEVAVASGVEDEAGAEVEAGLGPEATRSQEGHMDRVVAGRRMKKGGAVLSARSSASSLCSRRFSSVSVSQQRFRYSQSTSVCFSFVLHAMRASIAGRAAEHKVS
jgi:hypothetical protein